MNLVNIFEDAGDVAVFEIDNERAYEQVMDKFGHIIEWSGDYMVAPRNVFTQIEQVAHDAGGAVTEVTDDMFEATGLTFMGSPCTKDCSGHKAGYEWSEKRGGQNANSHSQSFNNGAAISVNAKNKQQQPAQQTKPQTAADKLRAKMADLLGPDKAKTFGLAEGTDMCKVCGQTPCNCTGITEGVALKFHTIELDRSQIKSYAKKYFECYNIEQPHGKFINNVRRLGSKKVTESNEATEIAPFTQMINSVDTAKTIKVGDYFSILAFEIRYAWKEIDATGFTNPKEVVDIKMHKNGTINYIKFADGDRYPRLTPATYQGSPVIQTAYFDSANAAGSALTALALKVPDSWEFDTSNVEQGVAEGKFNELSVMIADYHNSNITDVKFYGMYGKTRQQVAKEYANYLEEAISRRGFLKGIGAAAAAGAAGKASAIAGAFPTPSHQAAMYKAAADSNAAQARADAAAKAKADAKRLQQGTQDVERLNRVNYHGGNSPKPTNATWDGDSDFLDLDGTQYAKASRMPISGDVPSDLTLVSTKEGRQVYLWTRRSLKGVKGHYFYPAEKPNTINEFAPGNGDGDDEFTTVYQVYQCQLNDQFDWISGPLFQSKNLGKAHSAAYEMWKKYPDKCFMVWQPNTEASRGGYGPKGSVLGADEDDVTENNDPRHPSYAYSQMGQTKIDEDTGDEFGQKELKHTIARARAKFPRAASDTEALIMYVQDQEQQDVRKLDQVNDREDREIDRLDQEENSIEQRLQNVERKLAGVMESRLYYSVVGTVDSKLRSEFGLRKDKNGWYLKESADAKKKFQAYKAFGSPKLKEYDLSAVRGGSTGVISGADNPISPIGSVPRGQQKTRR